jgi:hypothetical protein
LLLVRKGVEAALLLGLVGGFGAAAIFGGWQATSNLNCLLLVAGAASLPCLVAASVACDGVLVLLYTAD